MCVRVEGLCERVVYFYYAAGHILRAYVCVCVWHVHEPASVRVCEVGAAECYHKLVGHSSTANQRSKWL